MTDISDDETLLGGEGGQESTEAVPSSLSAGSHLGDYEIEKLLGAGAMGEVYLARQMRLNQQCAVKVLPDILTKSADFEKRFESEGRSLARLDHPNVVRVLNAGVDSGRHFLTMEYVGGGSLDEYIAKRGTIPVLEMRKLLSEILDGLAYAHKREVIHRDLKPANVLRTTDGHAKISDFGLALVAGEDYMRTLVDESIRQSQIAGMAGAVSKKPSVRPRPNLDTDETILAEDKPSTGSASSRGDDETLLESDIKKLPSGKRRTSTSDASAFVGTIDYMSPEIRYGRGAADQRSDIYAVGVMAYQMLTGRKPMGYVKAPSKIVQGLSRKWDEWVFKCMEDDPANRFQSADAARQALPGEKASWWKISFMAGAAVMFAGVAFGGWWIGAHAASKATDTAKQASAHVSVENDKAVSTNSKKGETIPDITNASPMPITEIRGNMAIATDPPGAEVRINDSQPETTPCTYENLPAQKYTITAQLDGYETALVDVEVPIAKTLTVPTIVLKRETGALEIATDPPMLAWRFAKTPDGVQPSATEGTTPETLKNLPTGDYVVEFSRGNWPKELAAVKIEKGKTAAVSRALKGGAIYFASNVEGVSWAIVSGPENVAARNLKNTAPFTLSDLPPGEYVVEFSRQYWPSIRKKVTVEQGRTVTASVAIEKAKEPEVSGDSARPAAQGAVTERAESRPSAIPTIVPIVGRNWTVPDYGIEMIWIKSGSFLMGAPADEKGRDYDETLHKVTLTKGYWLGEFEVTQRQWQAVMGNNPSYFNNTFSDAPVEQVSWRDAAEFCANLTLKERAAGRLPSGYEYGLPTEAQWEYACRAGTDDSFHFGVDEGNLWMYGNYCDRSNTDRFDWKDNRHSDGRDKTAQVGSFKPNPWGFYDMQGNVWEWCADWYGAYPSNGVADPEGAKTGNARVRRGGCWSSKALDCRSANRDFITPNYRNNLMGFRLALRPVQ